MFLSTLVLLCGVTPSHAATRARFLAETYLQDSWARVAAGAFHSCQVIEDGTVKCWGANGNGQLGNRNLFPTFTPTRVEGITGAVAITAGPFHTCALLVGGTVKCWGLGDSGQLGNGDTTGGSLPVTVSGIADAVAITAGGAAGFAHTCALLANGTARCWGDNHRGQLGNGLTQMAKTPVAVKDLSNAIAIKAGYTHTCAVLAGGTVKCWGSNLSGQLGDGTTTDRSSPVLVANLGSVAAIATGREGGNVPAGFPELSAHTCALLANGTAKCWGLNSSGQLGDGSTTDRHSPVTVKDMRDAIAITAGGAHTCVLMAGGTGRCWGGNGSRQLGDGTNLDRSTSVAVGVSSLSPLINAVAITAGNRHNCALLADGSVTCWGDNLAGQLGSSVSPNSGAPIAVPGTAGSFTARQITAGRSHTCALRANGTVACWGSNDSGQVGDRVSVGALQLTPSTVSNLQNVVAIAAGEAHNCALLADGTAKCWGRNDTGQLGIGQTSDPITLPMVVRGLSHAVAIAAGGALGSSHTCALIADGIVRCWGANGSGQLGTGNVVPAFTPTLVSGLTNVISIAVGENHSCALVALGVPFCWGFNGSGQLGDGTSNTQTLPKLVSLDNTVAIAGGNLHTCALRADATAWCWGGNLLGQLGINSTVSQSVPRLVVNQDLPNPVSIAGGFGHSCATLGSGGTLNGGAVRCWGDNSVGQLGNSTVTSSLIPVAPGSVINGIGITFVRQLLNTVNVTTGRRHSCALIVTGAVNCWGENTFGQLGVGSTVNATSPLALPSFTLNIDPTVTVQHNERVTTVTVIATCEEGQWLHAEVTLTQAEVTGRGVAEGQCTGGLSRYPVTVPARGRDSFLHGPAVVNADATIREPGSVADTQQWTRQVSIVLQQ